MYHSALTGKEYVPCHEKTSHGGFQPSLTKNVSVKDDRPARGLRGTQVDKVNALISCATLLFSLM